MNLKEVGLEDTDRIHLAQDRDQWWVFDRTTNQWEMMRVGSVEEYY
jgi:hypothetical protein